MLSRHARPNRFAALRLLPAIALLVLACGCASTTTRILESDQVPKLTLILAPGDQLHIEFFGAPDLNTDQTIRRDGKISLKLVGDTVAAGMSPEALQTQLLGLYKTQLQVQSVSVVVVSAMPVFVTGAVKAPGRFDIERPITVLEAIMQAGGFDPEWANVRKVVVIRHENDKRKGYTFDFKAALAGRSGAAFYLQPHDIVYVPQKGVLPW